MNLRRILQEFWTVPRTGLLEDSSGRKMKCHPDQDSLIMRDTGKAQLLCLTVIFSGETGDPGAFGQK